MLPNYIGILYTIIGIPIKQPVKWKVIRVFFVGHISREIHQFCRTPAVFVELLQIFFSTDDEET